MRTEIYYKDGRKQWKYYCYSFKALIGDTAPDEEHLSWATEHDNICPKCGEEITKKDTPFNQAEYPVK